jgi:hypothetical protein
LGVDTFKLHHLVFKFGGQHIWENKKDQAIGVISFVIQVVYLEAISKVKS